MKTEQEHYNDKNKLIDITYQLVLTCLSKEHINHFKKLSVPERAAWVSNQLEQCGFKTYPVGSCWGVLDKEH